MTPWISGTTEWLSSIDSCLTRKVGAPAPALCTLEAWRSEAAENPPPLSAEFDSNVTWSSVHERPWGLELMVQSSGFRVQGPGFRTQNLGFKY